MAAIVWLHRGSESSRLLNSRRGTELGVNRDIFSLVKVINGLHEREEDKAAHR